MAKNLLLSKKQIFSIVVLVVIGIGAIMLYLNITPAYELEQDQTGEKVILDGGVYPRGIQIEDNLVVTYSAGGNIVLHQYNMTSGNKSDLIVIISGEFVGRSQLAIDEGLGRLVCIFNHGSHDGEAIGIAYAPLSDYYNPLSWDVKFNLTEPMNQTHPIVGAWEPYIMPFGEGRMDGKMLLFFSNQTLDADEEIDSDGYVHEQDGLKFSQVIDVKWVNWSSSLGEYVISDAGIVSDDLGGNINYDVHHKDGMASTAVVSANETYMDMLVVFESFPKGMGGSIVMVSITISEQAGVSSQTRTIITSDDATAPYISKISNKTINSTQEDQFVVSYRYRSESENECLGFVRVDPENNLVSYPVHAIGAPSIWPSIFSTGNGELWAVGTDLTTGNVTIQKMELDFVWRKSLSDVAVSPIIVFMLIGVIFVLMHKKVNITSADDQ